MYVCVSVCISIYLYRTKGTRGGAGWGVAGQESDMENNKDRDRAGLDKDRTRQRRAGLGQDRSET